MYCPVCFQDTLHVRVNGLVKLSFNGKSRSTSLFTYNLNKEKPDQIKIKLREKVVDFFSFYSEFQNKAPLKIFEAYSGDFNCTNNCKIDFMTTKVSVVGILFSLNDVKEILDQEAKKFGIEVQLKTN